MKGWLHCLLTNCPEIAIQHLQDWVLYQTALHTGDSIGMQQAAPGAMMGAGSLGRGRITKRDHVTRKTVTGIPAAAAAAAAAATAAAAAADEVDTSSHDAYTDSGRVDRSKGFDVGVALRGGGGHAHAGSPAFGVGDSSSAGATRGGDFASPDLPPVRFAPATAGGVLDSYGGSGTDFPVVAAGAAHNAAASATSAEHGEATYNLLDFFPKTAAAAAVATAALTAGAAGTGDGGGDAGAPGPIDHVPRARQPSQSDIMQVDVPQTRVRIGEHDAAAISGGVGVGGAAGVLRGEAGGGPESSLGPDLNIDSPSTVAGMLLSNDGEVASSMIDVTAAAAAAPAATKLAARRGKFV